MSTNPHRKYQLGKVRRISKSNIQYPSRIMTHSTQPLLQTTLILLFDLQVQEYFPSPMRQCFILVISTYLLVYVPTCLAVRVCCMASKLSWQREREKAKEKSFLASAGWCCCVAKRAGRWGPLFERKEDELSWMEWPVYVGKPARKLDR